ncbi:DUF3052 family protein [Streptodolium elevatio]
MHSGDELNPAVRMGLSPGQTVKEIGRHDDADELVREGMAEATGRDLLDPDDATAADLILLWFREGDGDLEDSLARAAEALETGGDIWLLTPNEGRSGAVPAEDIADAADAVGLTPTDSVAAGSAWNAARLAAPGEARDRRGGSGASGENRAE